LERSNDFVYVNIILRTDFSFLDDDSKKLFRSLVFIYQNKDQKQFTLALRDWFKYQNVKEWLNKYSIDIELTYLDKIFENHYEWTNKAGYNFTPAIFINGYEYPNIYDRKNLEFFINEIIEDTDFN